MPAKEIKADNIPDYKQGFSDGYTRALLDVETLWNACWMYWNTEIISWKNDEQEKGEAPLLGRIKRD